jgi:hypothetical protein
MMAGNDGICVLAEHNTTYVGVDVVCVRVYALHCRRRVDVQYESAIVNVGQMFIVHD